MGDMMKNRVRVTGIFKAAVYALVVMGLALSCENPFRAGLGGQVDIKSPTIQLTSPVVGDYLQGITVFSGTAEDDMEVASLWFKVEDRDWARIDDYDSAGKVWNYPLDTTRFPEGDIKVRLKVYDGENRVFETLDMAFKVKNGRPSVEIFIPMIKIFDSENPLPDVFNPSNGNLNAPTDTIRYADTGGDLKGQAVDLRGIADGYPQIKFWSIDEPVPGEWREAPRSRTGLTNVSFSFPLKVWDEAAQAFTAQNLPSGKYYRFQIKAKSKDGTEFVYPADLYSNPAPENQYVEVLVQSAKEYPVIELEPHELDGDGHPTAALLPGAVVEKSPAYVQGDFTLQVKASHSKRVEHAELTYTKEGVMEDGKLKVHPLDFSPPEGTEDTMITVEGVKTTKYFTANISGLGEGTYTFTVEAWGGGGTPETASYVVYIDAAPPEIAISELLGDAEFAGSGHTPPAGLDGSYLVNGVIELNASISDVLSGIKPNTDGYGNLEQKWLIVDAANHATLQGLVSGAYYPPNDYTSLTYTVIEDDHFDGEAVQINTTASGSIPGGNGTYYLHLFARDQAKNVGHKVYGLVVDQNSDKPVVSLDGMSPGVSNPNHGAPAGTGFADFPGTNGKPTNVLGPAQAIKVKLSDDDSLDLGDASTRPSTVSVTISTSEIDGSGNIGIDMSYPLSPAQIKEIFAPNAGTHPDQERVLFREGEITQANLRKAILGDTGSVLPDGVYKIDIGVQDLEDAKVSGFGVSNAPVSSDAVSFWFAVDSTPPEFGDVSPGENKYVPSAVPFTLSGRAYDENGPVSAPALKFYKKEGTNFVETTQITVAAPTAKNVRDPAITDRWAGDWEAGVNMNGFEGEAKIEITIADRFGNPATYSRILRVDSVKPTVELDIFTKTLEREGVDNYVNGRIEVSFRASDNFGLHGDGIKWWIRAQDDPVPTYGDNTDGGTFASGNKHTGGVVNSANRPYKFACDTKAALSDNLDYVLYIIAKDEAGNLSDTVTKTFRVKQDTDTPNFDVYGNINPRNVVGSEGLRLTGTIEDDDGFALPGSGHYPVQFQYSPDNGVSWLPSASTWYQVPAAGLTLGAGDRSIIISHALGMTETQIGADGVKKIRIRAEDGKEHKTSEEAADFQVTEKEFTFTLDRNPPEFSAVTLESPADGVANFRLYGKIQDTYLAKNDAGKYYVEYSLDGGEYKEIVIAGGDPAGPIDWSLPAAEADGLYNTLKTADAGTERLHTLIVRASDQSGKNKSETLSFYVDMAAPRILFSNISDGFVAPANLSGADWHRDPAALANDAARQSWYALQAGHLNGKNLSVISSSVPALTGSFEDDGSAIDPASFQYRIDHNLSGALGAWTTAGATTTGEGKNVNWRINIPAAVTDGVHSIALRVKDKAGNWTVADGSVDDPAKVKRYLFRLDREQPQSEPAALPNSGIYPAAPSAGGADAAIPGFVVSGTAWDPNLKELWIGLGTRPAVDIINLLAQGNSKVTGTWTYNTRYNTSDGGEPANKTKLLWSYQVQKGEYTSSELTADGGYTITVKAVDWAGRERASELSFTKDTIKPVIEFTVDIKKAGVNAGDSASPLSLADNKKNIITLGNPKIGGTAFDASSNLVELKSVIEKWNYTTGAWNQHEASTAIKGSDGNPLALGAKSVNWNKYLGPVTSTPGASNLPDGLYRMRLEAKDQPGNTASSEYVVFFIDREKPQLNPDELKVYYSNNPALDGVDGKPAGKLHFTGKGKDANRLTKLEARLKKTGETSWPHAANAVLAGASGTEERNWTLDIGAPTDAGIDGESYTLELTLTDNAGQTQKVEKTFVLDNKPPSGQVLSPITTVANGIKATGKTFIEGSVSERNKVTSLGYYLGPKTEAEVKALPSSAWRGTGTGWDPQLLNGNSTFSWAATGEKLVKFGENIFAWTLTVQDIAALTQKIKIDGTTWNDGPIPASPAPGYLVTAVPAAGVDVSSLKIWMRAEDEAGNTGYFSGDILINPWGDVPVVKIAQPNVAADFNEDDGGNRTTGYGGMVIFQGTASDNDYIWDVVYRVIYKDSSNVKSAVYMKGAEKVDYVDTRYTAADASIKAPDGKQGWMKAVLGGSGRDASVQWSFLVNSDGEIVPYAPSAEVTVQVLAFDANLGHTNLGEKMSSPVQETIYFGGGKPEFKNVKVAQVTPAGGTWNYGENFSVKDTYKITARAEKSGGLITEAAWRGEDTAAFTNIPGVPGNLDHYDFDLPFNSKTLWGGGFANSSGTYTVYLQTKDNSTPKNSAQQAVTVNIDNFYPLRDSSYAEINPKAAGTDYWISGRALDMDPAHPDANVVRGLKQVVAWFTRNDDGTKYIPINVQEPGVYTAPATTGVSAVSGRTGVGIAGTSATVQVPNDGSFKVVISETTIPNQTVWTGGAGEKIWSFKVDTTLFKQDGKITLHYLIYDAAGNASYYTQDNLLVMNNSPAINKITLFTSLRGETAAGTENSLELNRGISDFANSGFVSRDNLKFTVDTSGGNKNLHYRVSFVQKTGGVDTNALVEGQVYTIQTVGGVNWETLGAPRDFGVGTHFVATGKTGAATAGKAYRYAPVAALVKQTTDAGITDSSKVWTYAPAQFGSGPNQIKEQTLDSESRAYFLFKVWDSVPGNGDAPGTTDELKQNSDFALVGLNLAASGANPTIEIYDLNPYTEEGALADAADPRGVGQNKARGGIYQVGTGRNAKKSGHIEPRSGSTAVFRDGETASSTFARDQVSGTVILRGTAHDDIMVDKIFLKIDSDAELEIIRRNTTTDTLESAVGDSAWVADSIHWSGGHTVEWAYVWNSETKPAGKVVAENIIINARVLATSTKTGSAPAKAVDLVPYITGFERTGKSLNSGGTTLDSSKLSVLNSRSKQGWYSFSRGEAVHILGYNLKSTGNSTVELVEKWTGSPVTTALPVTGITGLEGQTPNKIPFVIPKSTNSGGTGVGSGKIVLKTTGAAAEEALNHKNDDLKSWNRESSAYTAGSTLWKDSPFAHIWETREDASTGGNSMVFAGSENASYTSMSLDRRTGELYGAWSVAPANGLYRGINNGSAGAVITTTGDMNSSDKGTFQDTDIVVDNDEYGSAPAKISLLYNWIVPGANLDVGIYVRRDSVRRHPGFLHDGVADKNSFMNPRLAGGGAVDTTGGRVEQWHGVWYNHRDRTLWYRWDKDYGATSNWSGGVNQAYMNNRTVNLEGPGTAPATWQPVTSGIVNNGDFGAISATANPGVWSAVDVTYTNKYPVVAYHDAAHDTVRLAYANSATPSSGNNWTRRYVMDSADTYFTGSGTYIAMKIDKANNIHLAFYNSVYRTVVYAKGTTTGAFTVYAVDNGVSGASWIDIAVDESNNPWITYLDAARPDNYDGAKIAYRNAALFTETSVDANNPAKDNTGWEAMNVPAVYRVEEGRISIEAWKASRDVVESLALTPYWKAAVGYQSDKFRLAYYLMPVK
jgi:hypothetical protein